MTWGNMEILKEDRIQVQTKAKVFEGRPKQSVPKSFFLGKSQKFNTSKNYDHIENLPTGCLLYTSPSPRDKRQSRMPSSA